ncbi:MAG TPA: ABC transporter ATP-binding protein [Melioribacteraceae bacterium]|nr:ABC transporter ATP-binding protein [Melioribacteraceae bacterium]
MLKIKQVDKQFGNINALININLEIAEGEFFGLLGPNGAGKSTLMNIIAGFLPPDAGYVQIDGKVLSVNDLVIRKNIGYVPQEISLYLELNALQNLKIFGSIYDLNGAELGKKIDEVLELVQLTDRKKDRVNEYSGGMKRRLNLAASLLHDPPILLCDEPTVGVDPQSRNAIFDMLNRLNQKGKTILYTTHYMEEAERLCSRLAIIDNGKIIAGGSLLDLINMLEKKETIKIQKTALTLSKLPIISSIGKLTEFDFYYEMIPDESFNQHSKIYTALEDAGIPNQFIQISRASLEDVFLNITGRSLRD